MFLILFIPFMAKNVPGLLVRKIDYIKTHLKNNVRMVSLRKNSLQFQ